MSDNKNVDSAAAAGGAQRQVILQKIYVKDASLEVPLAPQIFTRPWQPQVDVQVNTELKALDNDTFQIVLAVTVTAKLGEDVAFLAETHQAGVFALRGFPNNEERQAVLGAYCPGQIFPFARETIGDLVQRGGFPQLLLQPVNFEALYLEHLNRVRGQQAPVPAAAAASTH